jgi:hypothetical protein
MGGTGLAVVEVVVERPPLAGLILYAGGELRDRNGLLETC